MPTTKTTTATDAEVERQLMLLGITKQREELQARLNWLQQKEDAIRSQGLTGTPRTSQASTANSNGKKSRKPLSAAHKKKMSDAAKKRWAERKGTATAAPAAPATTEVPPNPLDTATTTGA